MCLDFVVCVCVCAFAAGAVLNTAGAVNSAWL
jgi:hypothetical protein